MIGVYAGFFLMVVFRLPFALSFIAAMNIAALVDMLAERIAYRPLRTATEEATLLTSLAVSIFIENLGIMTITAQPRPFNVPVEHLLQVRQSAVYFTGLTPGKRKSGSALSSK